MMKTVDTKKNPGLAKLPTPVRNKMGYAKGGGQVVKKSRGGKSMRRGLNLAGKTLRNREDNIKRNG